MLCLHEASIELEVVVLVDLIDEPVGAGVWGCIVAARRHERQQEHRRQTEAHASERDGQPCEEKNNFTDSREKKIRPCPYCRVLVF